MEPEARFRSLKLIARFIDIKTAREMESAIHSKSKTKCDYYNNVTRVSYNLNYNKSLKEVSIVFESDKNLIHGTKLEEIENENKEKTERFEKMLQEKYNSINDKKYSTLIKCRRCGSEEVRYDEKQVRSADEAATIFCSCTTCGQRWIMR